MNTRRGLIIGGVCAAGALAGYKLKPHQQTSLLGGARLASIVPASFGEWASRDVGDLVAPVTAGSLMSDLYSQTIERVYQQKGGGPTIMMLLAYGKSQTNALQLHRPEVCYPAFGFRLLSNSITSLRLGRGTMISGREIVAVSGDKQENILYWTRLGDFLPSSNSQQRLDRLKLALHGIVADGLLARFSIAGQDPATAFVNLRAFIPNLIGAISPPDLPALVGPVAARQLG